MQTSGEIIEENGGTTYNFRRSGNRPTFLQRLRLFVSIYWKSILIVVTPIMFLPLPIINDTKAYRCMYVVLIMAVYWVLELLPLPVTSMLPIVLFPTMGILSSDRTCMTYMKETNMMFMGGLMIAAGVQHSKLPKRVALKTIQIVGCSHRRLNFGLTFVTMFISMWVSNAAATTMMVPIVEAILEVLEQQGLGDVYIKKKSPANENGKDHGKEVKPATTTDEDVPVPSDTTICHYLSIAYAATIGGCCTLVGTATNSSFKGIYDQHYPNPHPSQELNFFWFMVYSTPTMIVMQLLIWLSLQIVLMGMFRPNSEQAKRINTGKAGDTVTLKVINEQYKALGPTTFHELTAGILFVLAVFLYIFRSPGFIPGWADVLHTDTKPKDGVTSMLIVILMFIVPMSANFMKFFSGYVTLEELEEIKASPGVVTWKVLKDKIPWGLFFLLGGGFCLAEGSKESGLSRMIAQQLSMLGNLPDVMVLLVVVLVTQFLTEFTSNVAIANLLLPVLAETANMLHIPPLYLMIPVTHACSMAFLMPVGTPPNAIVAGIAHIPTYKMAIGGILPKLITTILVWGSFPTWGALIYPSAAPQLNATVLWRETSAPANSTLFRLAINATRT